MEGIGICINSTMTNMGDMQTCAIADVNLLSRMWRRSRSLVMWSIAPVSMCQLGSAL
jgi:hypothetical protein